MNIQCPNLWSIIPLTTNSYLHHFLYCQQGQTRGGAQTCHGGWGAQIIVL